MLRLRKITLDLNPFTGDDAVLELDTLNGNINNQDVFKFSDVSVTSLTLGGMETSVDINGNTVKGIFCIILYQKNNFLIFIGVI